MLGQKCELAELLIPNALSRPSSLLVITSMVSMQFIDGFHFSPDLGQAAKCALEGKCEMPFVS